jgi:hypothetical protein
MEQCPRCADWDMERDPRHETQGLLASKGGSQDGIFDGGEEEQLVLGEK